MTEKYLLESTNDTTDRAPEIEKMLREQGVCILGSGVYYVSGVELPEGTTLMGMGRPSKLILDEGISSGYTVKIGAYCTVKGLFLSGVAEGLIELPNEVGERHGIVFEGTANLQDWSGQPRHPMINECFISGYNGGGITCRDTGYSAMASMVVSDCHITNCGAGINISHYSEYHKFTNILCGKNRYGCINNGGNNMFSNCGFTGNIEGFLMDNTDKKSPNNSHGSAVCCTFNHSDSNNGVGIRILGCESGYVFSGCQIFFSKIICENSDGILVSDSNFGRMTDISVKGGGLHMFTNCMFQYHSEVTVENNDNVKFINCFTRRDGEPVDI